MKVGIFGGSFNPPHVGHLIVAEYARSYADLDLVKWIPAGSPPHKPDEPLALAHHRMNMVEKATSGNDHFEVEPIELEREGPSYTIDTLSELRESANDDDFYLIVGGDSLTSFTEWREWQAILERARILAFGRKDASYDQVNERVMRATILMRDAPRIDVSSSRIRERVLEGASIRYLVPDTVVRYIHRHSLYSAI